MEINDSGLKFIESNEGFSATPYKDAGGRYTIGFGHLIRPSERFTIITKEAAQHLLYLDAQTACNCVNRYVKVKLNQAQFNALVDFTYNLGCGNFSSSTLLKLLNEGDYQGAADQFPLWDHIGTRVVAGLKTRRLAERKMFLG